MERAVLLFVHGGGFTKECWNPIIQRLQQSPLLQRVPCETVAFDWRFHGEKSDHSVNASVSYLDGDETKARVDHPLRVWNEWAVDDLRIEVKKLRATDRAGMTTRVFAIGHSMGALAVLQVEMQDPGTFQGIIAFEPVFGKPEEEGDAVRNMLVAVTMSRPDEWETWEEVLKHFKMGKRYRRWNAESMDAFLQHGVRQRTADGKFVLATTPLQEAALYCYVLGPLDFGRVGCPVTFEHAEESYFFGAESAKHVVQQYPHKYAMGDAIRNTTHLLVVEDPATCAARILKNLEGLSLFQSRAKL